MKERKVTPSLSFSIYIIAYFSQKIKFFLSIPRNEDQPRWADAKPAPSVMREVCAFPRLVIFRFDQRINDFYFANGVLCFSMTLCANIGGCLHQRRIYIVAVTAGTCALLKRVMVIKDCALIMSRSLMCGPTFYPHFFSLSIYIIPSFSEKVKLFFLLPHKDRWSLGARTKFWRVFVDG